MDRRTASALGTIAAAVVLALVSWALSTGGGSDDGSGATPSSSVTASATSGSSTASPDQGSSDSDTVSAADLPVQARETLDLIDSGGPFPYPDRDGVVFGNYEGLLPEHARGYYHEYTVPTPGESDRGARRIITGADGERYWTADHYASFQRIRS